MAKPQRQGWHRRAAARALELLAGRLEKSGWLTGKRKAKAYAAALQTHRNSALSLSSELKEFTRENPFTQLERERLQGKYRVWKRLFNGSQSTEAQAASARAALEREYIPALNTKIKEQLRKSGKLEPASRKITAMKQAAKKLRQGPKQE
ncbi:MAG TPA: hypothetical protein VJA40_05655 [archaeon]|nr:hypothetical protein [archaeon]